MTLAEAQGFRFVLRVLDGRVDGSWLHPTDIKPEWLDCTNMDDNQFADAVYKLQLWLESRREQ